MKKLLALFLAACLLISGTACGGPKDQGEPSEAVSAISEASGAAETSAPADGPYTVTDSRGKEVAFDAVPQTVISLLPSDTEILYALGVQDKLVAVDTYSNYPADAAKKQQLEGGENTNIEAIVGMNPDLVILGTMAQSEDQFKQLEDAGIKVVVTQAGNIEETYGIIRMLGKTVGEEQKAEEIVGGMKKDFEEIKEQVKNNPPKKVYIEISPLQYKLWSCGKGTFQDELLTLIGAENIFSDINSWSEVSEEQVLSRNPEIIITTVGQMFGTEDPVTEIKNRPNWDKIDAVKNNKVFVTDSDAIQRPGPRLATAAKDLMKIVYG